MILLNPTIPDGQERRSRRRRCTRSAGTTRPSRSTTRRPTGTSATRRREPDSREEGRQGALQDAVVLRLGLGQEEQAIADATPTSKNYGASNATETARDRVRHRRALRRQGRLGRGAQDALAGVDGRSSTKRGARHPGAGPRDLGACLRAHEGGDAGAGREYAKVRALWADPAARRQAKIDDAYQGEDERASAQRLGKALDAVGEATSSPPRSARRTRSIRSSSPSTRARDEGRRLKHVKTKVADWMKKKQAAIEEVETRVPEDHRAPAGAAAALGHRGRLARRSHVGQLRRRLPRAPDPEGLGQEGLRGGARRQLTWRRAQRQLLQRLDEASEPIKAEKAQAGAQALPRLLGQVPVLRRVSRALRGVAREELQDRIPRRRRAPRRADAARTAASTTSPPPLILGRHPGRA